MKVLLIAIFLLSSCFSSFDATSLSKPSDIIERGYVYYSDFGADTSGQTNAFQAIIDAHDFANDNNLPVRADKGATYFIGEPPSHQNSEGLLVVDNPLGATVLTDTDWGNATFVIDDSDIEVSRNVGRNSPHNTAIFTLARTKEEINLLPYLPSLTIRKNQTRLDFIAELGWTDGAMIRITDGTLTFQRKQFGRPEAAQVPSARFDIILVCKDGYIDPTTPVLWDFNNVTALVALPFEDETLTITGGNFERIARAENLNTFFFRGIHVQRDRVVIDGIRHEIEQEGESRHTFSQYDGMVMISDASNVVFKNSFLTGTRNGYDFSVYNSININVEKVEQINCILSPQFWGIMGGNDAKNLVFDDVKFNRIDIHRQVHNLTIKNSEVGYQGIPITGSGKLHIENTTSRHATSFVTLREDWGSSWNGDVYIIKCTWIPHSGSGNLYLFEIQNCGRYDFGFETFMPRKIVIDELKIESDRPLWLVNNFMRLSNSNAINLSEELIVQNIDRTLTVPYFLRSMTITGAENVRFSVNFLQIVGISIGFIIISMAAFFVLKLKKEQK
jgi:hypothetical protein